MEKMINIKEKVEYDSWWKIKVENSSFWFDNWTRQRALYYTEGEREQEEELKVKNFITNGTRNEIKLKNVISKEMVRHVITNIRPKVLEVCLDKALWRGNTDWGFTIKSTYHIVRGKKAKEE